MVSLVTRSAHIFSPFETSPIPLAASMRATAIFLLFLQCFCLPALGRLRHDADERTERMLRELTEDRDGRVNVIIGLAKGHKDNALDDLKRSISSDKSGDHGKGAGLKRVSAASARLTKREIKKLLKRGDIEYIEEDFPVYLDSINEIVPYGIKLSQGYDADKLDYQSLYNSTNGACSDPSSMKVAIIDSGVDVLHPDLPCRDISQHDTNCIGKGFGVTGETWYAPLNPHGTHVFGIIGARRNNDRGIVGQISGSNVCYIVAQIFGENGSSRNSAVIDAVDWAIEQGATVINMSLGSETWSFASEQYFAFVRAKGVFIVSAAGNDGTTKLHYPASYESVIGVASVDASLKRSEFSQYNHLVNIAAPGSSILSTFPFNLTNAAIIKGALNAYSAALVHGSPAPDSRGMVGSLVYCRDYGLEKCDGPGGHICLINRGETSFAIKAANCEAGGGIAAIIYNNVPNITLVGALTDRSQVNIPVLGMSPEDATNLYMESFGQNISLQAMEGYALMDGTSMATPHVTGALVEIWRQCPLCSAKDVEDCLLSTALPLEDNEFDYGFLQTRSAFECLVNQSRCCTAGHASEEPTLEPSLSPTSTAAR